MVETCFFSKIEGKFLRESGVLYSLDEPSTVTAAAKEGEEAGSETRRLCRAEAGEDTTFAFVLALAVVCAASGAPEVAREGAETTFSLRPQ